METYVLKKDLVVFGFQVKSFPEGIGEAFDSLIDMVPERLDRSYYGLSYMTPEGEVVYIAAVEEKNEGEAEKNHCERYTIENGEYLSVTIKDWRQKTDSIKDVFHAMMDQSNVDHAKPCVEWYKNDNEMCCMLKVLPSF